MDSPEAATTLLECFALTPDPPPLVPADPSRAWMDRVPGRHAYRCLPMAIANTYGWEVRSPCKFEVEWNGGERQADLTFRALDGFALMSHLLHSNFAQGILTFHTGYMFRTPPGWNLMASGPLNAPKHGIAPLAGVIETDWLPYPFTMNWKMTFPGIVTFEKDEPFCLIYPVRQGTLERFTPVIRDLELGTGAEGPVRGLARQPQRVHGALHAAGPGHHEGGLAEALLQGRIPAERRETGGAPEQAAPGGAGGSAAEVTLGLRRPRRRPR